MTGSERHAVELIRLIDNSTYVPRADPTYVALGFLDEYWGRTVVKGGETVETFYPDEKNRVPRFVATLEAIAKEGNITTEIRQEIGPQGHIAVISRELTAHLDKLYAPNFDGARNFTDVDGRKRRAIRIGIGVEMFPELRSRQYKPEEVDCRFSYLLGCHIRYGKDNSFKLANAAHKVKLVIELLECLGASWIKWSWTIRTAPIGHRIEFGPDAVLTRLLGLAADFGKWDESAPG